MHRLRYDFRACLRYLRDSLLASDPALERLRSGLRAVITAGACAGAFLLQTRLLGLEYKLSLAGIVVPMIAAAALPDAGRRQQQITMAWVPVVASAVLVLGSLVAGNPWLSGICFLLVIFGAFEVRRFGPRAGGLGTIAYQSFFYALLLKVPPSKALWDPLFVFSGCAIAFVIRFWLVPEHPGRTLRSELRAWRARIAVLMHVLARAPRKDARAGRKRIDAQLQALNGQSLALESRIADFAEHPDEGRAAVLRTQVLHAELAAETVAAAARAFPDTDAPTLPGALRWRLHRARDVLAALPSSHRPLPAMRDERKPQENQSRPEGATRRALQACAAALGAMLAGRALAPDHWFWAVFASFVVFTRSATVGQTLSGAWRQVLATMGGVAFGIAAAGLVHGNRGVELSLLFVFIAAGYYAFHGMQNTYTVLLSAMLAMLYELMGMNSPGLLLLRLGETAIGAASAILAARLVFPAHTRDESGSKSADLLRAAGKLLRTVWSDAQPERQPDARHAAMRELDRKLQALRQALGPVTGTAYPGSKENRRQHLTRLARIAWCVRHCCFLAMQGAPALAAAQPLREAAGELAARMDGVAALLDPPAEAPAPQDAPPALVLPAGPEGEAAIPLRLAVRWLGESDRLLHAIRDELAAPGKP
jgi:uncharacterized membrane protein YccC